MPLLSRDWVEAPLVKRMAAQQAAQRIPHSPQWAMARDGLNGVFGARGVETACRAEQRRQGQLISPDDEAKKRDGRWMFHSSDNSEKIFCSALKMA